MPDTDFFATFRDLEPTLREIESNSKLKYVSCTGSLFSETPDPIVFNSLINPPIPDFDERAFLVVESSTRVFVDPVPARHSDPESPEFPIIIEEGKPYFFFSPSAIIDATFVDGDQRTAGKAFRMGNIYTSSADSHKEYSEYDYYLYRNFAHPIRACLARHGYLYGREALAVGEQGAYYAWSGAANLFPTHQAWKYRDVMNRFREEQAIPSRKSRLPLERSCRIVERMGYEVPRDENGRVKLPISADEDASILDFFKTRVDNENFDRLTIPRCFMRRSQVELTSFRDSDLRDSRICWNDVLDCDFSGADLSYSLIGWTTYYHCSFAGADLSFADMRRATFRNCDFANARLDNTQLTKDQLKWMNLDSDQRKAIKLRRTSGPMPDD